MKAAVALPEKSPQAFRTISEVATELDLPQHVLRFWETRFAQIRPVKRAGSRRYYRPDDVDLLRGIRTLLYSEGYTIRGVQKILREQGARYVAELGRQPPVAKPRRRHAVGNEGAAQLGNGTADPEAAQADFLQEVTPSPDETARGKLKDLMQELHNMRKRLRAARERLRA